MTVQWINEEEVGAVGRVEWLGVFGLGQPPTSCPGGGGTPAAYTTCRNQALSKAQGTCQQQIGAMTSGGAFNLPGGGIDEAAATQALAQCVQAEFFANFNASNCFQHCPAAQTPCTSDVVIRFAQEQLGREQTGVWTAADQAALAATGETFQQLVGSCGGAAPVPATGPAPGPSPTPTPAPTAKKRGGGLGLVLLAAAAATAIALAQS